MPSGKRKRQQKTSIDQKEVYVSFMEQNPSAFKKKHSNASVQELWQELAEVLNDTGQAQHSVDEWKLVFDNWRYCVTYKQRKEKKSGVGPDTPKTILEQLEERAMTCWGTVVVEEEHSDVAVDHFSEESFNDKNVLWLENTEEDTENLMDETVMSTIPEDTLEETDIYGKAWAAQFRQLNPIQKLYAKRVIDEALFQGRMGKLTNQSSNLTAKESSSKASAIKKIIPMLDRILVQRAEALTTTKGGIMLPEKAVGKVLQGTVVAVGPGSRNSTSGSHIPIGVKEGDRVLLPEFGGTKVEMEDKKEYILFRESDILAKLE